MNQAKPRHCKDCVNRGAGKNSNSWCGPLAQHVARKGVRCGGRFFERRPRKDVE